MGFAYLRNYMEKMIITSMIMFSGFLMVRLIFRYIYKIASSEMTVVFE